MLIEKYARVPFVVDAIQVTRANIHDVAEWCGGTVEKAEDDREFIKVKVYRPLTERQSQAFAGDWVLYTDRGSAFKVYTSRAFERDFEPVFKEPGHLEHAPTKPRIGVSSGQA